MSRSGLPTIQGVVALYDGESGSPLALMDSIEITALRTGGGDRGRREVPRQT